MKNDKINTKNCKEDGTKFLGNKSIRNKNKNYQSHIERKWKPYKFMTFEEKKRLADRESFKDHMKQEERNNPKILKNLDFDRKSLKKIIKPATPHNTSQFLSTNFCIGRNDKIPNSALISDPYAYTYNTGEDITSDGIDDTDDYCIPGGSMTEILNNKSNSTTINADIQASELTHNLSASNNLDDLNNFKEIIENQERLINHLITILNKSETSTNNKTNGNIP